MAILKPLKFRFNGRVWYHQTFTPERGDPELVIRLYDEDGEFVREFISFPEMKKWLSDNSKKKEGTEMEAVEDFKVKYQDIEGEKVTEWMDMNHALDIFLRMRENSKVIWAELIHSPLDKNPDFGELVIDQFSKRTVEVFGRTIVLPLR